MVRTILMDGEPWFVAADVCRALDLSAVKGSYAKHIRKLDLREKRIVNRDAILNPSPGLKPGTVGDENSRDRSIGVVADEPLSADRGPTTWLVSESGLFPLMLRSRDATTPGTLPYRFRRWATGEVLPSVRRTGS